MYSREVDISGEKEREIQDYCIANHAMHVCRTMFTHCTEILDGIGTYETDRQYAEAIVRIVHGLDGVPQLMTIADYGTLRAYYEIRETVGEGMRRATKYIERRYSVPE